jgi:ankyrin repeat protein
VAEKEDKLYVKGDITFMKDDPGRQQIGSFNPITDTEWTEMAYVGNTARLCAAIVDRDLKHVRAWLSQKDADPNQRDHTGRTPLQLAVSCSTTEIVQALIDADARLVARMANGYTALHLAAERGEVAIIKAILERSERNEAEHEEKEAQKKDERKKTREAGQSAAAVDISNAEAKSDASDEEVRYVKAHHNFDIADETDHGNSEEDEDEDDLEDDEDWNSEADSTSMATESFVKVKESAADKVEAMPEDNTDEPDFYDINVTSWDVACSPLHLAILNGHIEAVKALVADFGADVLLPVKLLNDYDKSPRAAILTLVLALALPQEQAQNMARALFDLGATSSQADLNGATALHYYVNDGSDALDFMLEANKASATAALQHIAISKNTWNPQTNSALLTAISNSDTLTCLKILENGVAPEITFKQWVQQAKIVFSEDGSRNKINNDPDHAMNLYRRGVEQPLVVAIANDLPDIALALLEAGADPNSMPRSSAELLGSSYSYRHGITVLDIVQTKLEKLQAYEDEPKDDDDDDVPLPLKTDEEYLNGLPAGSYKHWVASTNVNKARERYKRAMKDLKEKEAKSPEGLKEKRNAVAHALGGFKELDAELRKRGAKAFKVLHPGVGSETVQQDAPYRRYRDIKKPFEVVFKFRVGELHDELKDRYLQL